MHLIKLIKPSNTTLGDSQVTVTCDSPSVVFDGLISLIKFKSKYNGMENIKKTHYAISSTPLFPRSS